MVKIRRSFVSVVNRCCMKFTKTSLLQLPPSKLAALCHARTDTASCRFEVGEAVGTRGPGHLLNPTIISERTWPVLKGKPHTAPRLPPLRSETQPLVPLVARDALNVRPIRPTFAGISVRNAGVPCRVPHQDKLALEIVTPRSFFLERGEHHARLVRSLTRRPVAKCDVQEMPENKAMGSCA
jgi:hypothetical protein